MTLAIAAHNNITIILFSDYAYLEYWWLLLIMVI